MKKQLFIILKSETLGEKEFEFEHAQNVLQLEERQGLKCWTIPENSKFVFENGEIISRSNKRSPSTDTAEN